MNLLSSNYPYYFYDSYYYDYYIDTNLLRLFQADASVGSNANTTFVVKIYELLLVRDDDTLRIGSGHDPEGDAVVNFAGYVYLYNPDVTVIRGDQLFIEFVSEDYYYGIFSIGLYSWDEIFICTDSSDVLKLSSVCDYTPHCTDGSDESTCNFTLSIGMDITLSSHNYPGYYPDNAYVLWLFHYEEGLDTTDIKYIISFNGYILIHYNDYLKIGYGSDPDHSPSVEAVYTGYYYVIPRDIYLNASDIFIEFYADSYARWSRFQLQLSVRNVSGSLMCGDGSYVFNGTCDFTPDNEPSSKVFVTDPGVQAVFVADLDDEMEFRNTSINGIGHPRFITYDSLSRKIYWSEWPSEGNWSQDHQGVCRADIDVAGPDKEIVTTSDIKPYGIAIANTSRTLYIAYRHSNRISSMSIGAGSNTSAETHFFVGLSAGDGPIALAVDEQQGYLYWTMENGIARKSLHNQSDYVIIHEFSKLSHHYGLSLDLTRDPRRIFFSGYDDQIGYQRIFYMDTGTSLVMELTQYWQNPTNYPDMTGVTYYDGVLYWVLRGNDWNGIGIMTDYDKTNPSYIIQEKTFKKPLQILIATIEP